MKSFTLVLALSLLTLCGSAFPQAAKRDSAIFVMPSNEFYDSIMTSLHKFYQSEKTPPEFNKVLSVDFSQYDAPKSMNDFKKNWANPSVSQGNTGTCWDFSTTSFLESEVYRLSGRKMKFSEMYTDYWEYVRKAMGYVRTRGKSKFGPGSEANAVLVDWEKYGIVPEKDYTGLLNGQPFYDESKLYNEMDSYLKSVKAENAWNPKVVKSTIESILDHYMGTPPTEINVDGKEMTPKQYLKNVVKLDLNNYVSLVSFCDRPYYQRTEYNVSDNWWHNKSYVNVPLKVFMHAIDHAVRSGYTESIWGDVSEPGIYGHAGIAVIPSWDIPSNYINADARIFRFYNHTTTDDHGMQLIGYTVKDGKTWYLIRDTDSSSRNNDHPGYDFFSSNYVKLKMLGVMLPKSAIPQIMNKLK